MREEAGQRVLEAATGVIAETVALGGPVRVSTELVFGRPASTLIDASKDAQMIVVGCRGRGAWRRGLLGSVSTALVHHAHCPVAVIHEETDAPVNSRGPVVVGIDGSRASELATAIAFDEASRRDVELIALHAWADYECQDYGGSAWPDIRVEADQTLAERLAGWQERYPDVTVRRVVERDHAAQYLVEQAESAQLVVVGSHGRGGFTGMLLGSVSSAVVHSVQIPVIVARQD
jgi:nucleotide-binding universal stress UspA family protein